MKNVLIVLAVALFCAFSAQAAALSAPTVYGPTYWECDTAFIPGASEDTLTAADTITFAKFTKRRLEPGYEYAIRTKLVTDAADSIRFELISYGSDGSTAMEYTCFDTVGASATQRTTLLPVGRTVLGDKHTLTAIGWIAGKNCAFTRIEVWRRALAAAKQILQ